MTVVKLQGISRAFPLGNNTVTALDKLDLTLDKGEFVVLRGASGSGKSTLLNLIGAMDAPDEGEVFIHGQALSLLSDKAKSQLRSRYIGFIFQAFNLIPVLTALENVQYPLSLQKVPDREAKARAEKALAQVGLADFVDRRPNQLSGGQMQRVAIARALVTNPDIILADEPTANLDSETSKQIMDLLGTLNRETGVTFLFATHHDFVLSRASRILELKDGHIVRDEQPQNLQLVEEVHLGEKLG
ncbi:ABC transporter ATP-binding protein [Thalassomonas viridans]|uniref:ABC transporter ATP-binding protein n=1 Tax=Thalassomonas viridans TaxID=137584 RepID=A0AAE9Z981_9GAMM|nr:ABC transporter ATP-binding protein [Thalassomonas viridans]WDE09101.1 ABC transporter ATP-binding protein [Thalassomonas viridans]